MLVTTILPAFRSAVPGFLWPPNWRYYLPGSRDIRLDGAVVWDECGTVVGKGVYRRG